MIVNLLRVHTLLYLSSVVFFAVLLYVNYVLYYCQHSVNILIILLFKLCVVIQTSVYSNAIFIHYLYATLKKML